MKKIYLLGGVLALLLTSGCIVPVEEGHGHGGGHEWRGHGGYREHDAVFVPAPVVVEPVVRIRDE